MITIRRPDDFHVHFRRGEMLRTVAPHTAAQFARALVMPNTDPPILLAADALVYRDEIRQATGPDFEPLMTIQITDSTTPEVVREARDSGVVAGKVYPRGVTTNSHNGVTDFQALDAVFGEMGRVGMVLSIHGQHPTAFILRREGAFLGTLRDLAARFPHLRIVLEHVSTQDAVRTVAELPANVAATITLHHLQLTLDDVLADGGLRPHNYCQPVAQAPEDRSALRQASVSGNPKFFFGSDSAPHPREHKESACGCAGVFTAPVILPALAQSQGVQEPFLSEFGARFYGLPLNAGTVTLVEEDWTVPEEIGGVVPFRAGETLHWKLKR